MRGGVGHPAPAARGTEAAALARERHEAIVAAVVAAQAQEAVSQDAAAQEGAELLLDEVRRRTLARPRAREEPFELLANDARAVFWRAVTLPRASRARAFTTA
jgi:hypothetical protein